MILTKAQAIAVYDAMCALNNVYGKLHTRFDSISVAETFDGQIKVISNLCVERFTNQNEFAEAYGID